MTTIKQDDLITSVTDSLQYISYYHSPDFVKAMHLAWQKEESESARNAIAQILVNSRMSAEGKRPICQDTGIVVVFVKVGMNVRWETGLTLQEMIDEECAGPIWTQTTPFAPPSFLRLSGNGSTPGTTPRP